MKAFHWVQDEIRDLCDEYPVAFVVVVFACGLLVGGAL